MNRRPLIMPPHYTPDHPDSRHARTLDTEDKFNKQLHVEPHQDTRPIALKERAPIMVPRLNLLYGSGRSEGDWRYFVDNYATGTLTTVANATVTTLIKLANQPNWRLEQWPQGISLYLCIRKFSLSAQSAITTVGAVDCQLNDIFGNIIPLGDFVSNSNINEDINVIIPTPITDPGNTTIGNLLVALNGTTPTVSIYNYQLGFSAVYLLPSLEGYHVSPIHRVLPRERNDE